MKKMLVIDGNSIMYRAYFATAAFGPLMQARSGLYTNALYGFVNMINKLVNLPDVTNIFVAFDKGKKTFRHQAYNDYKAGRAPTPEEFKMQIPYIKQYLDIMNIKHLELDDYEADDIVGSMAKKSSPYFDEVIIISGDHDLLQLASGNIHVNMTIKGLSELDEYTEDNFVAKMGFPAKNMIDFKGLIGDKSDNLPGVAGVGEKTATKLLNDYVDLDGIYNNIDSIKGKLQEKLILGKESAFKTRYLATIYTDIDLPYTVEDTLYIGPKMDELRQFYESVDFKSFLKRLDNQDVNNIEKDTKEIIKEQIQIEYLYHDVEDLKKELNNSNVVYLETELSGENYHKDYLLGLGIVVNNKGYFLNSSEIDKELIELLNNNKIYAVDIKKTICALKKKGFELTNFGFDLTLAAYLINPSFSNSDVKSLYDHFMENDLVFLEEIYGKKTIYQIPLEPIYEKYAIDKAKYLGQCKEIIDQELEKNQQLDLLYKMEIPLAMVLADMELNGFKVLPERLEEIGKTFKDKMDNLEKEIYDLCGEEFNISSPKQLGIILFEKLALGKGKKNKTGYSTTAEELEKLAKIHPVPKLILEYRKFSKLYSTYVVGLINEISDVDHKVHTIFKQSLTLTGRLSSIEPNIQNIPVRSPEGRLIRSAFVASNEDGLLISADYSQIELRVLAHMANCERMIDAFNNGIDLHSSTASQIFNKELSEVTKEDRRMAKAVNFGIVYGMSPWGLAEEIGISSIDASNFINRYFMIYPEIKQYLDQVVNECKTVGYTTTLYHRRRYIPEINSSNGALRQFGERTSKNAPIQGTAADIIKMAMINVYHAFKEKNLKSKLIAQVHDELIVDCVKEETEIVKVILKEIMEDVVKLKVKLTAEVAYGYNWDMK